MTDMYYYDVTVHYGIVNGSCYDTREHVCDTLDEALAYVERQGWSVPIEHFDRPALDCVVAKSYDEHENGTSWDYMVIIRRMKRVA